MTPQLASVAFCGILFMLSLFQIALIAGVPLGRFAWGGQHRYLPPHLRIGSLTSIFIYAAMSLVVLSKAGVIDTIPAGVATIGAAAVSFYCLVGIFMNAISQSRLEQLTMVPIATMLFLLSLAVTVA